MRRIVSAVLPALLLAACGQQQQDETPGPAPTPAPTSSPAAPVTPATVADSAIPERFRGVWDAETGTCDPASDLRLDIQSKTVGFYESLGTVTGVSEPGDGSVVVDLAMEGEGETWAMSMVLEVSGEGEARKLIVRDKGQSDLESRKLKHCPA